MEELSKKVSEDARKLENERYRRATRFNKALRSAITEVLRRDEYCLDGSTEGDGGIYANYQSQATSLPAISLLVTEGHEQGAEQQANGVPDREDSVGKNKGNETIAYVTGTLLISIQKHFFIDILGGA